MIFGTAGHIDHGKSTLVKALTGVDPDRLREEKARGITIDLGYAYTVVQGRRIGFVDVPGHERLVRNMLAGATGIDRVLLVVAADDGVMPQTREHLAIVSLLGLRHGCVVLTKVDRADEAAIARARAGIDALVADSPLAGSPFARAPVFPVSATTGEGLDALRDWLAATALEPSGRRDTGLFRLPIDRVFTLPGAGLVVTGTVHSGRVAVGDELLVGPAGRPARVRALHTLGEPAQQAGAGVRCSLNLSGDVDRESIGRGDWALAPDACRPTARFDVRLALLPGEARALRHWTQVHAHIGAADLSARVAVLNADERIEPGASDFAQIVLDRPTIAAHGDRVVLRDQSASRTIGGAIVLDIDPPLRRRRVAQRLTVLAALESPTPSARLAHLLVSTREGVEVARLAAAWATSRAEIAALAAAHGAVAVNVDGAERLFAASAWHDRRRALLATLGDWHASHPDEVGIERDGLRRLLDATLERPVFQALVAEAIRADEVRSTAARLHLAGHRVVLSPKEQAFRERAMPMIDDGRFDPPWMRDVAKALRVDETSARGWLRRLAKAGELVEVVPDLFYSRRSIDALVDIVLEIEAVDGVVETPRFRDRVGLGRKRAIQILEHFDRVGAVRRDGDRRWAMRQHALVRHRLAAQVAAKVH
ncbi:MAG: selenocysteine-specific translation elongation factor [Lautropia sp.]